MSTYSDVSRELVATNSDIKKSTARSLALVPIAVLTLLVSVAALTNSWSLLRVTHMAHFADLSQITYSADCAEPDAGKVGATDCDPFGRAYNYPPVWASTFKSLGIGRDDTMLLGRSLVALTLILMGYLLWLVRNRIGAKQALLATLAIASPPFILMIERGNTDLFVVSAVVLSVITLNFGGRWKFVSVLLIALATGLKIYPAGALLAFARRPWSRFALGVILSATAAFLLAVPWAHQIRLATPSESSNSFGAGVLVAEVSHGLKFPSVSNADQIVGALLTFGGAVTLSLLPAFNSRVRILSITIAEDAMSSVLFFAGVGLFLLTFLTTTSFDYRLFSLAFILLATTLLPSNAQQSPMLKVVCALSLCGLWISYAAPHKLQALGDLALYVLAVILLSGILVLALNAFVSRPEVDEKFANANKANEGN